MECSRRVGEDLAVSLHWQKPVGVRCLAPFFNCTVRFFSDAKNSMPHLLIVHGEMIERLTTHPAAGANQGTFELIYWHHRSWQAVFKSLFPPKHSRQKKIRRSFSLWPLPPLNELRKTTFSYNRSTPISSRSPAVRGQYRPSGYYAYELNLPQYSLADTSFFTCTQVYSGNGTVASLIFFRCWLSFGMSSLC